MVPNVNIAIISYPHAMRSAVHGLSDMFHLANRVCSERGETRCFSVDILDINETPRALRKMRRYAAVVIPPTLEEQGFSLPSATLQDWLLEQHTAGALLCSVCAGAFAIAETGLLDHREATTHWGLGDAFRQRYPKVHLNTDKILIDAGNIITAGGLMSWIDLGLELVARFTRADVMRQLGKSLIVDTGGREQRYYQSFAPAWDHGDQAILKAQQILQSGYRKGVTMKALAEAVHLTERTFLRRFVKATGLKPNEYLQHLRIQKACELLEETNQPFEKIGLEVGYGDISACRKVFVKIMGLSPSEFRKRFSIAKADSGMPITDPKARFSRGKN